MDCWLHRWWQGCLTPISMATKSYPSLHPTPPPPHTSFPPALLELLLFLNWKRTLLAFDLHEERHCHRCWHLVQKSSWKPLKGRTLWNWGDHMWLCGVCACVCACVYVCSVLYTCRSVCVRIIVQACSVRASMRTYSGVWNDSTNFTCTTMLHTHHIHHTTCLDAHAIPRMHVVFAVVCKTSLSIGSTPINAY